jgi:hypothetical protein
MIQNGSGGGNSQTSQDQSPEGNQRASGPDAPSASDKASDLEDARSALENASDVVIPLWISYLSLLSYLAVTVGPVTSRDVFLESNLKLPILSIDVPMFVFSIGAPLLFGFFHFYTLLHFNLMAARAEQFNKCLEKLEFNDEQQDKERQRLGINVFVQYLAGQPKTSQRFKTDLLWLTIHLPMLICSVGLILPFQWRFLPYHSRCATSIQLVIVAEVLWISFLYWRPRESYIPVRKLILNLNKQCMLCLNKQCMLCLKRSLAVLGAGMAIVLSGAMTVPLWVNRDLNLSGDDFSNPPASLKHRNLENARLDNTRLPDADFSGAKLEGANLQNADLHGADLRFAQLQGAHMERANLCGADLTGAALQETKLNGALLTCALLDQDPAGNLSTQQREDSARTNRKCADFLAHYYTQSRPDLARKDLITACDPNAKQ